MGVNDV